MMEMFWLMILNKDCFYDTPPEMENDPDYVFPTIIRKLSIMFVCNPAYIYEKINKKARETLWNYSLFIDAVYEFFRKSKLEYESDQINDAEEVVVEGLRSLLKDLDGGKIKESELLSTITKLVKINLSKK